MKYVERPFIYVQHVGSLIPQDPILWSPKLLQADAPFILRGRAIRVKQTPTADDQTGTQALLTRWRDSEGLWRSTDLIPVAADMQNNAGQGGNPGIVYPEVPYLPGGSIELEIRNNDPLAGRTLDVTVYWIGVKLYPDTGSAPTYPARCSMRPFWYGGVCDDGSDQQLVVPQLGITDVVRNQIFKVRGDADFACRTGQCGAYTTSPQFPAPPFANPHNLFVIVRDAFGKAFSDDWVDVNVMFGNGSLGTYGNFSGPANPGLFVPELYLPANSMLLFDWMRDDGAFVTAADGPQCIMLILGGAKVYPA